MRTAVIGCGAAGSARAAAMGTIPGAELMVCVDSSAARAEALARTIGCEAGTDWQRALADGNIEVIILATATALHAPIAIAAMEARKHVFCESPLARNPAEAEQMLISSQRSKVLLAAGTAHRFAPAARKVKELLDAGAIGQLLFLRGWSGLGEWGGAETWYADPELSGGGTMMSNGIVLLDLARWFVGDFREVVGYRDTALWPIEPVEDNAFALFRNAAGRVAMLHSSWTQWKGFLKIEIYGTEGYVELDLADGRVVLGGRPTGPLAEEVQSFDLATEPAEPGRLELQDFFDAIHNDRTPESSACDGLRVLQMAHAVYVSSDKGCSVTI